MTEPWCNAALSGRCESRMVSLIGAWTSEEETTKGTGSCRSLDKQRRFGLKDAMPDCTKWTGGLFSSIMKKRRQSGLKFGGNAARSPDV